VLQLLLFFPQLDLQQTQPDMTTAIAIVTPSRNAFFMNFLLLIFFLTISNRIPSKRKTIAAGHVAQQQSGFYPEAIQAAAADRSDK